MKHWTCILWILDNKEQNSRGLENEFGNSKCGFLSLKHTLRSLSFEVDIINPIVYPWSKMLTHNSYASKPILHPLEVTNLHNFTW